jgi:acyl-coenzyme A thioesterase PaaI-like protein
MVVPGIRGNHVYDHLGVRSRRLGPDSGETLMPVTDDIRTGGGLRAAPLGLAFEQGVASYLFDRVMAVPTQISMHVRDAGVGVVGIRSETHLARLGRTLAIVDGEIHDSKEEGRLIAYGSIIWSVIGGAPDRPNDAGVEPDPPSFEAAGVDVVEAAGITALADGSSCRVEAVTPQTAGPGGILHAGILQLLCEEAALVATRTTTGVMTTRAVDCVYTFIQPGRTGPFVATAEVLYTGEEGLDTKVQVRDLGNDDRILTLAFIRTR